MKLDQVAISLIAILTNQIMIALIAMSTNQITIALIAILTIVNIASVGLAARDDQTGDCIRQGKCNGMNPSQSGK